jgi:acyl-CoA thioesterase-1
MSRTRAISLLLIPAIIIAFLPSFFQLRSTSGDSLVADYSVYCIGDSLTHYYWPGQSGTLLGPSYTVVNKGVDGNTTQMMLDRFNADVLAHDADCVVVWGGINDVGRGYDVSLIEDNLQSAYTQAHNAGIKVVAITISPFISQGYLANKKTVNLWIMNTAANVDYRVDVYPLLEDPNTPDAMRPDYTVDGEHLNSAGGAVVAWAVRDALQSNVINDPVGDLVVFSQDYTNTGTVPSNMCLALDSLSGHVENETLSYNGTSHCVELDATEGAVGKLFVGGLSPSLSTTITLDMGMGRTEESATVYICAGGAWLGIRLRNGAPTDDLEITSYYYNYTNLE